jgi:hypothetical protein
MFLAAAQVALERGMVVYAGTGLSRGAPTNMPLSKDVVTAIGPALQIQLGISVSVGGLLRSLEAVADEASSLGTSDLEVLKGILAGVPEFRSSPPNDAHYGLAALLREGLVTVLSVNWDRCIEEAAAQLQFVLTPTTDSTDRRGTLWRLRLNKIYGCVTQPGTLRVSTAEIMQPDAWAAAETDHALQTTSVHFVGLGTVPDSLKALVEPVLMATPEAVHVVAPTIPDGWTALLAHAPSQFHGMSASIYIDEIVRGISKIVLTSGVERTAAVSRTPGRALWADAGRQVAAAFAELPALSFINWIRQGSQGVPDGQTALDVRLDGCLAAIAGMTVGRDIHVSARSHTAAVTIDNAYVELAVWPGSQAGEVIRFEEDRVQRLKDLGVLPDPNAPIVHIAAGHDGLLPNPLLVRNLVGSSPATGARRRCGFLAGNDPPSKRTSPAI